MGILKAISPYNRSLKIVSDNRLVLMNEAGALMDMRIYDETLETIEKAIDKTLDIAKWWA